MAAVLGRTEVQLRRTGRSVIVPTTPTAKLMYYFDCVCSCVEPNPDPSIRRLRNYRENHSSLSSGEQAALLVLCLALSPDKLVGSIFFPARDNEFDTQNEFLEVSAVSTRLVVAESILVGGQQRRVRRIMMFEKSWIESYYLQPMLSFAEGSPQESHRALPSPRRPSPPQQPPRWQSQPPPRRPNPPPQPQPSRRSRDGCTIL